MAENQIKLEFKYYVFLSAEAFFGPPCNINFLICHYPTLSSKLPEAFPTNLAHPSNPLSSHSFSPVTLKLF